VQNFHHKYLLWSQPLQVLDFSWLSLATMAAIAGGDRSNCLVRAFAFERWVEAMQPTTKKPHIDRFICVESFTLVAITAPLEKERVARMKVNTFRQIITKLWLQFCIFDMIWSDPPTSSMYGCSRCDFKFLKLCAW